MYNIRAEVILKKQKTYTGKRQVATPSKKDIRKRGTQPPLQKKIFGKAASSHPLNKKVFAKEASSHHGHKKGLGEKRGK